MRVLLLGQHVFHESTGGHEVVYRDPADPAALRLETLLPTLPEGWRPELIVYRIPEYHAVPVDMANAPCAAVVMTSDWNIHFEAAMAAYPAFDHIFTERMGVETLQRAGFSHVSYFPLFGFRPEMHRRPDPPLAPDDYRYDISIVCNLNPSVQRERAGWIARLARLGRRFRVGALTQIFEEAYTRAVQRSRITFNRSIRREMNMRAYEAPACGSLLFLEEENVEVRDFLREGEECVLYNERNFEDLVEYYLAHEAERARLAAAGGRAIQPHTYEARLQQMIAECERRGLAGPARRRRMAAFPRWRQALLAARNLQTAAEQPQAAAEGVRVLRAALAGEGMLPAAENPGQAARMAGSVAEICGHPAEIPGPEASALPADRSELYNNLAVLELLSGTPAAEGDALLQRAGARLPALLNRAVVAESCGAEAEAERRLLQAAQADAEAPVDGLLLAPPYEAFRIACERAGWEDADDPAAVARHRRHLLRGEAWRRVGRLRESRGDIPGAAAAYEAAAAEFPQVESWYGLARCRERLGSASDALAASARAVQECPLYLQIRWGRLPLLEGTGRCDEQRREALDMLALVEALPTFGIDPAPVRDAARHATQQMARALLSAPVAQYRRALEVLLEGLQALPGDRALERMAGVMCAIMGEDARAVALLGPPSDADSAVDAAYRGIAAGRERTRQALAGVRTVGDKGEAPPGASAIAAPGTLPLTIAPPLPPAHAPIRIAHLHQFFPAGGVEQYILDLAVGCGPEFEHAIFLYEKGGPLVEEARRAGLRVEIFPVVKPDGEVDPDAFAALVAALRAGGFDVAHLHFGGAEIVGHHAARRAGIPVRVETIHWTVSSVDPDVAAVICPSAAVARRQARPERALFIPLGIDETRFVPRPAGAPRRRFGRLWAASGDGAPSPEAEPLPDAVPVVGRVSRLVSEKDPATFVRAAALVQKAAPEAEFLLVGDGPQRAELEALAASTGARVRFAGSLRGDDLVAAYQSMDVFAYTPQAESFGLVVAEAMACGLPVVCTPLEALSELVRPNHNGFHAPPGDPQALAEAVLRLLDHAKRRQVMGARSRAMVEQQLTRRGMVAAHQALYRQAAARREAVPR